MSNHDQNGEQDRDVQHDLEGSLELLVQVVGSRYAARQRSLGAALKPLLVSESFGRFSETALGFPRFGDFLREAQRRELISLYRDSSSPDLEITPFDQPALLGSTVTPGPIATSEAVPSPRLSAGPRTTASPTGGRIRRDLWRCFMDWRYGYLRVYDRSADAATLLPVDPPPLEPPEFAELRERLDKDAEGLVAIEPVEMADQLRWMQQFASTRTEPNEKAILAFALSHDRPLQEFARASRSDPQLERAWLAERTARVAEAIGRWAEEHSVEVDMWSRTEPQRSRPPRSVTRPADSAAGEQHLRALVHRAVDRMPASDLMRLSIPVEFMVEAG